MNQLYEGLIIDNLEEAKKYIKEKGGTDGRAPVIEIDIDKEGITGEIFNMHLLYNSSKGKLYAETVSRDCRCIITLEEKDFNVDYILLKNGPLVTYEMAYFSKETKTQFLYVDLRRKEAYKCRVGNVNYCDNMGVSLNILFDGGVSPLKVYLSEYYSTWILLNVC